MIGILQRQIWSPRWGAFAFVAIIIAGTAQAQDGPNLRFQAAAAATSGSYAAGAVGPAHIVSVWQPDDAEGPAIDVFTRAGVLLQRIPLRNLFEDTSAFSPSVFFDPHRQRFVLASFGYRQSAPGVGTVPVAVSRSANPLDGWHPLVLNHGSRITGVKLGFNRHWYAVTVYDAYAPLEPGRTHLYVLESVPAAAGALEATSFDLTQELGLIEYFDPHSAPCATYDGSDRLYLVGTHTNDTGPGGKGLLRMARIEGLADAPVFLTAPLFPEGPAWTRAASPFPNIVPPAPQPVIPVAVPEVTGPDGSWNDSISSAVFRNGYIWCAHTIGVGNGESARPAVQWWQISPMTGTAVRTGRISDPLAPAAAWFAPALAVNSANEMLIALNRSSATEAISSYYVLIDGEDTVIRRLNAGSGSLNGPRGAFWPPVNAAAVDPLDSRSLWAYALHLSGDNSVQYWWAKQNPVAVELGFISDTVFAPEGTSVYADVKLSDTLLEAAVVNFVSNDGSAAYGEDYLVRVEGEELPQGTLVISAGETRASLEIVAIEDNSPEAATESASIDLLLSAKGNIGPLSTLQISIGDSDERPAILFEETAVNITETGPGTVDLVVSLDTSLGKAFPVSIDYAITGGTATFGEDYAVEVDGVNDALGMGTLAFDPDDPEDPEDPFDVTRHLTVRALNDSLFESAENLTIELSNPVNALAPSDPGRWLATVAILDNDLAAQPSVSFQSASSTTTEAPAASGGATVALSHATGVPVEVDYMFQAITAAGADYIPTGGSTGTLLFNPGQTAKSINFAITDDGFVEGPEFFRITLTGWRHAAPGAILTHTHTINDNDGSGVYLWLDPLFPTKLAESAGTTELTYHVSSSSHSGFLVSLNASGTALGGLVDFGLSGNSFFVEPAATSGSFELQIVNDLAAEEDEIVNLVLVPANEDVTWLPRTPPLDSLMILDDDEQRSVQFAATSQAVGEGNGFAEVLIQLSEPTGKPVTIEVAAFDGDAQAGSDYRVVGQVITFPAGASQYLYSIELTDDSASEFDEVLGLRLQNPTPNVFIGGQDVHYLTIADDDPVAKPLVNFAESNSQSEEGDVDSSVEVALVLAQRVDAEVSATVALRGGEAVRNEDFLIDLDPVVFEAGTIEASLTISVIGDQIPEGNEELVLRITSVTNGSRGTVAEHVITLVDDEGAPAVQFAAAGSPAAEGVGTALVPVVLTAPARHSVTVDYAVTPGTASGDDFTSESGTIQFAAGQMLAFVPVSIVNDNQLEGAETILLTLNVASGLPIGFPTQHVLTVEDNDAPPAVFVGAPATGAALPISEAAGDVLVLVGLTRPATAHGSVNYTIAGTATEGEDYLLDEGSVHFSEGDTVAFLTMTILQDVSIEETESISISLMDPVNFLLDPAATLTYSIVDDDGSGLTCALPCAQPCEAVSLDAGFEVAVRAALLGIVPDPEFADLDMTGVGDAAHARLLDAVLADPGYENHCCILKAWINNLVSASSIIDGAFPGLADDERSQLQVLLAGIFTTQLMPGGILVGEGVSAISLDPRDFDTSAWPYLAADGDADLDGVCNAGEYNATWTESSNIESFLLAALNPALADNGGGCAPCIGEGGACAENGIYTADTQPIGAPDRIIRLSELLRVIQLFNSAGFGCEPGTEDGYQPNDPDQDCCPHDSDYNGGLFNWKIDLSELLRVIQFFNTGGYTWCSNDTPPTEDGFCPGLGR